MKIVTVQQMRDLEQAANAGGHPYAEMMEQAGQAVAQAILARAQASSLRALVLVGAGNNGGDGLVCARHLAESGARVQIYIWKRDIVQDRNYALAQALGIPITWSDNDADLASLQSAIAESDVIVDALLGTGVTRPIQGTLKELLKAVGQALRARTEGVPLPPLCDPCWPAQPERRPWMVAVDVPSGLNCDTGEVDSVTLRADLTVTFGYPKLGHFRFPAAAYLGQLLIGEIGIPAHLANSLEIALATPQTVAGLLPPRPVDAHKGTFGKAMIVAGSANYVGAAYLAGNAAARAGAGLVTLAIPTMLHRALASKSSETTYLLLPDDRGALVAEGARLLQENWEGYTALLLGPGMGRAPRTARFVSELLCIAPENATHRLGFLPASGAVTDETRQPPRLVVDADGLNILAELEGWWKRLAAPAILTPHPGEMARLLKATIQEVEGDRLAVARKAAKEWGHVVVLKGAFTVIADPGGQATLSPYANPALASAGTGDVLAGTIAGLLAQGMEPYTAAVAGTYLHGLAGEMARQEIGEAGVLASDLLLRLPRALAALRQ